MKTLNDSGVFNEVINNKNVIKSIKSINLERDAVELSRLSEPLTIISKKMNLPTKNKIIDNVNKNKIVIINNPLAVQLPKYLSVLGRKSKNGIIMIIDISKYANQNENIDIPPKILYGLLENATITLELMNKWDIYISTHEFIKNLTITYSKLLGKVLDKLLAINIESFRSDLVHFLVSKFFLINVCGLNNDSIDNIAYASCFNKSSMVSLKEFESNTMDGTQYDDIFCFIANLKQIQGMETLQIRSFVENWVRMYGESTVLSLDYLPAFVSSCFNAMSCSGINKEYIIDSVAGKYISKAYMEFSRILK